MNDDTHRPLSGADFGARIAKLSPSKRALLLERLSRGDNNAGDSPALRVRPDDGRLERSSASVPIAPAARTGDVPLSFAQQRLWVLDRLLPETAAYNIPTAWRLEGPLEVAALARSLEAVVARHEPLRTRIVLRDGEPVQVIDPPPVVALPLTDLSLLPPAAREARARQLTETEARQPFDLEAGPLLRAQLLRLAADEHRLLLTVHHSASDGWSAGVLHRELAAAYGACVQGAAPAFPALPIQYADYAVWQRAWLQGEVLEEQLSHWKQTLAGVSPLALPTDRPRPAVASHRGAQQVVDLPRRLTDALTVVGRREGATLFMTLLAAFQVLLARYSGQDDIAVGTPIAGRRRPELEGLIGFFVNTLVLRTNLSGNPRFRELLGRARDTALDAYTHQDLPFEKLVEELAPARDLSRHPLFQALFVLQNAPGAPLALAGLEVSRLPIEGRTAKFDLTLSVRESATGCHARWEYATDLFDAASIARLAGHFQVLLEAIVADPEQRIGELPLLTAAERQQLLVEWNDTAAEYPRDRCVHQLFEAQAARTPEAVAVVCEDRRLTYAALNARANQLAHHLIARGVGPEVLVGLCVERSLDMVVGLLGILKAGAAYAPLDPRYPRARLAFMLADTHAPVLLTQQGLLGQLPPFDGRLLCLDRDWPSIATEVDTDPPCRATTEALGYVIYTSGSTGTPKGILLPHATLTNLMAWHGASAPGGRVAQFTSISFDVSLQEIFHALLSGKTLIVVDDSTRLQPEQFVAFLQDNAITDLFVPNIVLQYLAQAVVHGQRTLHTLTDVSQAGEVLTITPVVRAFFEAHPACRLHNHYGPSESHIVTAETLSANPRSWPSRPAIGSPISNTRIYILGRYGEPVPVGVAGELHVAGAGLARGYLNRRELTTEKFVPDPFSTVPGARLYRTGDRARYLPDGHIEFLGRLDDQVKIRGFRIEPGEIEAVLAEHPAVRQAVVLAREDTPGDRRLVAYVVPADAAEADTERLRSFLRERLPDYMRPSAYVLLEYLPLTPSGKIDRTALLAPDAATFAGRAYEAPVGEIETALAQIWGQVLKIDRVGRQDHFFELGGHSLLAVQVVSRIRRRLNLEIPLRAIFEQPTIETLAVWLLGRQVETHGDGETDRMLVELEALADETAVDRLFNEDVGGKV